MIWPPTRAKARAEIAQKRLRRIRSKIFDYEEQQEAKASRLILKLKQRVIDNRVRPQPRHWMFACE